MISNTKIGKRITKKTNSSVVETVLTAKKNKSWGKIAQLISGPNRKYSSVNLGQIEENAEVGDTIIVPGKVLSKGNITKKVRICAMGFSDTARDKIEKIKGEAVILVDEIKKNPSATGIKIIK